MKVITGTWQFPNGVAAIGSKLFLQLSQDATALNSAQVSGSREIVITLNSSGQIPASTSIWANDELTPSTTSYYLSLIAPSGEELWAENLVISGASPINLNSLTP